MQQLAPPFVLEEWRRNMDEVRVAHTHLTVRRGRDRTARWTAHVVAFHNRQRSEFSCKCLAVSWNEESPRAP